ncbi:MAG: protein-export membrane protein SecD [Acidobacteria bacterium RIFCSPLOWO2_12_FULL_67_14b]|nr:MAG: protein-export membrane protein SecD [Acidobacteria bacterium RIFCSPLOWO2_12_FULL_67_14b]
MSKNLRWKVLVIFGVVALAVWSFYPPGEKIRLGLDLKGGVHLVMRVQTDDALRLETQTTADRLAEQLKTANIAVGGIAVAGATSFTVTGVTPEQDGAFRGALTEVEVNYDRASGAAGYTFTLKPNIVVQLREDTVNQALTTIERRVNELGVAEPIVARHSAADQILVQLPGVTDVNRAKEIIRSTALLELKQVEQGPFSDEAAARAAFSGNVPPDLHILPGTIEGAPGQPASTGYYVVRRVPAVTGRDLRNARPTLDENNRPAVSFSLNNEGARKFGIFTQNNIGRQLAIVMDNRVVSAPQIQSRIDDEGRITGNFTNQESQDLSLVLRSGALPASLTYLEERTVGPSLGADSIRAGVTSAIGGLAMVTLFLLFYYRLAGFNALVAIAVNLILLMGLMAYVGATMTLPGIAGFILTIGMGVDSNVLIFERIKEELATSKGVKQAVAAGFDRVLLTILDTHVASLIAAAFLFQFGTGPIRGFAMTLSIGLMSNVFTAYFVSRTLFELTLSKRQVAKLSI